MRTLISKAHRRELYQAILLICMALMVVLLSAWHYVLQNEIDSLRATVIQAEKGAAAAEQVTRDLVTAGVRL